MKKKFLNLSRLKKQVVAAAADFICIPATLVVALALHLNTLRFDILSDYLILVVAAPIVSIPIFTRIGLYRAVIRYIDHQIVLTVSAGAMMSVVVVAALGSALPGVPFSISPYLMFGANLVIYLLISRFSARGFFLGDRRAPERMRVAIYGAGHAKDEIVTQYVETEGIQVQGQCHNKCSWNANEIGCSCDDLFFQA